MRRWWLIAAVVIASCDSPVDNRLPEPVARIRIGQAELTATAAKAVVYDEEYIRLTVSARNFGTSAIEFHWDYGCRFAIRAFRDEEMRRAVAYDNSDSLACPQTPAGTTIAPNETREYATTVPVSILGGSTQVATLYFTILPRWQETITFSHLAAGRPR